jgi:putative addiction module killer protein
VYVIETTIIFDKWLKQIKDEKVIIKITGRIEQLQQENFSNSKYISKNLYESRINVSGGIRVYYTIKNNSVIILLVGGDKSSQKKDIKKAKKIIRELK